MKTRDGFVSNSSSSSFIVSKHFLSPDQIDKIKRHIEVGRELGMDVGGERDGLYWWEWEIEENEHELIGRCNMDNFEMQDFLERIGVPKGKAHFHRY
jgi:hypothetical protein